MTTSRAIQYAQAAYLRHLGVRQQFEQQLDADFPSDFDDSDDEAFEAWNDAYEQARMDRGGFDIDNALADAADELIVLCRAAFPAEAWPAFDAALQHRHGVRRKVLDICLGLSADTLDCLLDEVA